MSLTDFNNEDLLAVSRLFKVISNPTRLAILFFLREGSANVGQISDKVMMEQSATSHQLKTLKEARLVKSERSGKNVYYELDDDHVFSILKQVLDHIQEVECDHHH